MTEKVRLLPEKRGIPWLKEFSEPDNSESYS